MTKQQQVEQLLSDRKEHSAEELIPISHRFSHNIFVMRQDGRKVVTRKKRDGSYTFRLL